MAFTYTAQLKDSGVKAELTVLPHLAQLKPIVTDFCFPLG